MDMHTLIVKFWKIISYILLFIIVYVQLPLYIIIFSGCFCYYTVLYFIEKNFTHTIKYKYGFNCLFPEVFSWKIYIFLLIYTPRHIAFLMFHNMLKFKINKITFKQIVIFMFIRFWVYLTNIPLFTINLVKFWRAFIIYSWLYYDQLEVSLFFNQYSSQLFSSKK